MQYIQYMLVYSSGYNLCEYEFFDNEDSLIYRLNYLKKFYKNDKDFYYYYYYIIEMRLQPYVI